MIIKEDMIKFYNTLTRKKEPFKPLRDKVARIYSCGPTVYDFAHLGNLRTYVFADILRRTLEFLGYRVKQVINITDVGHLTQDSDSGEDKVEKSAKEKKKSAWEIARFYENQFLKDLADLNILKPHKMPRATEHIKEQIKLIKILEKKRFTYIIEGDGVYFDTAKFQGYGDFAGRKRLKQRLSRIGENKLKKNPWDFALWKFSPKDQKRQMEWSSPWGVGFPGWHIECSAMSRKYLGQPFDIHTGGVDHISIHHQNEIAQSQAAFGTILANYWLHGEFLNLGQKRMGKSEGNLITLADLKKAGFHPLSFRLFCLNSHYRKKVFFNFEILAGIQKSLIDVVNFYQKISNAFFSAQSKDNPLNKQVKKNSAFLISAMKKALADDLNISKALGYFFAYLRKMQTLLKNDLSKKDLILIKKTFEKANEVFALLPPKKELAIPKKIIKIVKERQEFRRRANFKKSDALRKKAAEEEVIIEDLPNLTVVYKKWPR